MLYTDVLLLLSLRLKCKLRPCSEGEETLCVQWKIHIAWGSVLAGRCWGQLMCSTRTRMHAPCVRSLMTWHFGPRDVVYI